MREFNYDVLPGTLLSPGIVKLLAAIREYKGRQELYLEANPDVLSTLSEVAKIQSIDASNRIEGIHTTDKRLEELAREKATPRNRNEEEIAGYRDVLALIHESYDHIRPTSSIILQFHRDLYRYTSSALAGSWKITDNIIAEIAADGQQVVRFKPLPAMATPGAIEKLCNTFDEALSTEVFDQLLLICLFIFDFICIHPFNDGNGRMSRLMTLLLLYRADFLVGKYVSIEKLIEQSKESYYETLYASSVGWNEGTNNYEPFVRYMLGIVLAAYREFSNRVEGVLISRKTKAERIENILQQQPGKVTKKVILEQCPDISETTVERTLATLLKEGKIQKVGAGRTTGYTRVEA